MKLIENQSFFRIRVLAFIGAVLLFCPFLAVGAVVSGPGDSLAITLNNPEIPAVKQKSLIQSMNKEQLSALVDYLFEMDTLPAGLVNEINTAIANLKYSGNSNVHSKAFAGSAFPASDLYACWEINNLF